MIQPVAVLPRQFVSSVTAFMVLFCNILCACGNSSHACESRSEAHAEAKHDTAHCHGHQHESRDEDEHDDGQRPTSPPCDHHQNDSSCQHCQPASSIGNDGGKMPTDLTRHAPVFWPVAFLPSALSLTPALLLRSVSSG